MDIVLNTGPYGPLERANLSHRMPMVLVLVLATLRPTFSVDPRDQDIEPLWLMTSFSLHR